MDHIILYLRWFIQLQVIPEISYSVIPHAGLPAPHLPSEVSGRVHSEGTAQPQMPRVPLLLCQWIHTVRWTLHAIQVTV